MYTTELYCCYFFNLDYPPSQISSQNRWFLIQFWVAE